MTKAGTQSSGVPAKEPVIVSIIVFFALSVAMFCSGQTRWRKDVSLLIHKHERKLKSGCKLDKTINVICLLLTGGSSGHKQTPSMTVAMFQEIRARKNG